jgi:FkbM family methyltransferase
MLKQNVTWTMLEDSIISNQSFIHSSIESFDGFIVMSSCSLWAKYFLEILSKQINIIGLYDENFTNNPKLPYPYLNLLEIIELSKKKKIKVLDFSRIPYEIKFNRFFCERYKIECIDYSLLMMQFNLSQMYEMPQDTYAKTLELIPQYKNIYSFFIDELSQQTFLSFLMARLTGNRSYLYNVSSTPDNEYFSLFPDGDGLFLSDNEVYVDIGAYRGETIYKFLACCNFSYKKIDAFEPDKINFAKLREVKFIDPLKIKLHNKGASDENKTVNFNHLGLTGFDPNSSLDKHEAIELVRLDDEISDVSVLKIDVEGSEDKVINGSAGLISSKKPKIAAGCYHYSDNLLNVANAVINTGIEYKFKLRHYSSYIGDTCFYATI